MQIALSNHLKLLEKNFPLDFGCKNKIPSQHRVNGYDSVAECHPLIRSYLQRMQKEYHLEFVEIFCHKSIREIDISKKVKLKVIYTRSISNHHIILNAKNTRTLVLTRYKAQLQS